MKKSRYVFLLVFMCVFAAGASVRAYAADTTMTLAAGKTYEFVNNNIGEYCYISNRSAVSPPPKYDYVYKDKNGVVESYGSATGNFMVSAGGRTVITVSGDLDITYPSENIKVSEISGKALRTYTLGSGKTVEIANKNPESAYSVTTENTNSLLRPKYDYVYRDISGGVTAFDSDIVSGGIKISEGGSSLITAAKDTELLIYMPGEWAVDVSFTAKDAPALYYHTVTAGKTVLISNKNGEASYNLANNGTGSLYAPKYDYVYRDYGKNVIEYASGVNTGGLRVSDGGTTIVTAKNSYDLIIWMPNEWTANISFASQNSEALYYYALQPGKTLTIKNDNKELSYELLNNSAGGALSPKFDYVYKDNTRHVTGYGSEDLFGGLRVAEGGTTVVTSKNNYELKLWMPGEWAGRLTFGETDGPALFYYVLPARKTLSIRNKETENSYDIHFNGSGAGAAGYDYVYKDSSGFVTEYGTDGPAAGVFVAAGGETIVTGNNAYALKLSMPYEWEQKFTLTETAASAVYSYTLSPSSTLEITNKNKDVSYSIAVNSDGGTRSSQFDYVFRDESGYVTGFGSADIYEGFTLDTGATAALTATGSYALKIWFPQEWLGSAINVKEGSGPVVRTYKLGAGKTLEMTNNYYYDCYILTNSGNNSQTPEVDYAAKDFSGRITDYAPAAHYSSVPVGARSKTTVTAGKGYDLRLYVPEEWLKGSGMTIKETDQPAIYYRTVNSGQGLRITNNSRDTVYSVSTNANEKSALPRYDYVYKDGSNNVTGYGLSAVFGTITVDAGGVSQITVNKGSELKLWMPYEWAASNALTFSDEGSTIYSYTLTAGSTIELVNNNENYAYSITTNSTDKQETPKYDYVMKDSDKKIAGYGSADMYGGFIVMEGGKTVITAKKGSDLRIWFPYEWSVNQIKINKLSEPALYHHTVSSDKTIEITNATDEAYNIKNTSGKAMSDPKYGYEYKALTASQWSAEELMDGLVSVRPNAVTAVRAANGYDLRLWMPYEWLKSIQIKNR